MPWKRRFCTPRFQGPLEKETTVYARFGQELYSYETLTAAAILAETCSPDEPFDARALAARVAYALPNGTPATRQRIAVKLLQRIAAGAPYFSHNTDTPPVFAGHDAVSSSSSIASKPKAPNAPPPPSTGTESTLSESTLSQTFEPDNERLNAGVLCFARLLAHLRDTQARHELVFYAAARADRLIGAIAREILYPFFIEERIPPPYEEDEFIIANAGLLLAPEPILTAGVVSDYARRAWGFDSERTVGLALRILRQAGILLSAPLLGERGRVAAYTLAPHSLSLPTLLWGLHHEYGQAGIAPAWDQVGRAQCAQLFVVPPSVVTSRLWEAERAGLVGCWSASGTRRVALKVREADALSRLLLSGPYAK